MGFLAAPFLWAMAAAGIPVVLHFIGRSKPIAHLFPAMKFILKSQRVSSRALRLKHLLILALRIALLLLAALALARPVIGSGYFGGAWGVCGLLLAAATAAALHRREFVMGAAGLALLSGLYFSYPDALTEQGAKLRGDFVIIMDQSMSMTCQEPEGTRFDLARKQALRLLDRLSPESRVALIFAAHVPERMQSRLTLRHDLVRQKVLQAEAGGGDADLSRALAAAGEIVAREKGGAQNNPPRILLFTDMQRATVNSLLKDTATSAPSPLDGTVAKTPLVLVNVATDNRPNGGMLSASLPASTLPAESVSLASAKFRPVDKSRPALIQLFIDEKLAAQKLCAAEGQDVVDVNFDFPSGSPGPHSGRLHLDHADRLPLDQDLHLAYTAGRPASALILEAPGAGAEKSSAFYLKAALQLSGRDNALSISGLNLAIEGPQELDRKKLSAYKVVMLADCASLSDKSWSALQQWTDEGGGLFVWLGPRTDLALLRRHAYQEHAKNKGLLPGIPGAVATLDKPQSISIAQPEHPLFAHFTPGVQSILRSTLVSRCVKTAHDIRDTQASVLMSLGDGSPLLLEKTYGRGRVLLAAIDPGFAFSNLPKQGEAFVTLALDATRLLAGQDQEVKAHLGQPLVLNLPSAPLDQKVFWLKPGSKIEQELRADAGDSGPAAGATVVVPPLSTTGVHQFKWTGAQSHTAQTRLVEVNHDPAETDLATASAEQVKTAFADWKPELVTHVFNAAALGGGDAENTGARREFTAALLIVLAALLLAEVFLANRLYRQEDPGTPEVARDAR
jgi:hypothetical protein